MPGPFLVTFWPVRGIGEEDRRKGDYSISLPLLWTVSLCLCLLLGSRSTSTAFIPGSNNSIFSLFPSSLRDDSVSLCCQSSDGLIIPFHFLVFPPPYFVPCIKSPLMKLSGKGSVLHFSQYSSLVYKMKIIVVLNLLVFHQLNKSIHSEYLELRSSYNKPLINGS